MRAAGTNMFLAGLFLMLCCLELDAAAASTARRHHHRLGRLRPLQHKQQQQQSDVKSARSDAHVTAGISGTNTAGAASAAQTVDDDAPAAAAAVVALLPACVPKYVTDLVMPPLMPITNRPLVSLTAEGAAEKQLEKATRRAAVAMDGSAEDDWPGARSRDRDDFRGPADSRSAIYDDEPHIEVRGGARHDFRDSRMHSIPFEGGSDEDDKEVQDSRNPRGGHDSLMDPETLPVRDANDFIRRYDKRGYRAPGKFSIRTKVDDEPQSSSEPMTPSEDAEDSEDDNADGPVAPWAPAGPDAVDADWIDPDTEVRDEDDFIRRYATRSYKRKLRKGTKSSTAKKASKQSSADSPSLDDDYWDTFTGWVSQKKASGNDEQLEDTQHATTEPQPPLDEPSTQEAVHRRASPSPTPVPSPPPPPPPSPSPPPPPSPSPAPVPSPTPPPPDYVGYDISIKQISQNVLPTAPITPNALPGCPALFGPTNVYAYGPADAPGSSLYSWPAATIEAQRNTEVRVRWNNELVDAQGNFLPHIFKDAIDQTLHWANPGALGGNIDSSPCHACMHMGPGACVNDTACITAATTTYAGPVPTVTHLHGQNAVYDFSDGYTEAWYLPNAKNVHGYQLVGSWYQTFFREYVTVTGNRWHPGSATFVYNNTQPASPLWFHDHTLGITRLNVYAGLSGSYFIREKFPSLDNGPELPGLPYPAYDGIIDTGLVRELTLAIQDRAFTSDSQLWYPVVDAPPGAALPNGPLPPRWMPEFAATMTVNGVSTNYLMMTVNGRTYPRQVVYPDAYRLRILNSCNTRTMQLSFARSTFAQINPLSVAETANEVPFYVVGNDGGFFPEIQGPVTALEIGPAERYDVVIDFSGVLPGEYVFLLNNGPEPDTAIYDGTNNGAGLTEFTAQIMRFDVRPLPARQTARPFSPVEQVRLNTALAAQWAAKDQPLGPSPLPVRRVALLEELTPDGIPMAVYLGVVGAHNATVTPWSGPVTTNGALDVSQYWDIINLSADAHPIHLHDVDFKYLGRWRVDINPNNPRDFNDTDISVTNPDLDPLLEVSCSLNPTGKCAVPKDTIMVLPGTRTRIGFQGPSRRGLYVWHCHLLEHEENEMMVPLCFGNPPYPDPRRPGALMCPGPA